MTPTDHVRNLQIRQSAQRRYVQHSRQPRNQVARRRQNKMDSEISFGIALLALIAGILIGARL